MITIDDPDLEAMLRVIEAETGEPPAAVLRRALVRALDGRADDLAHGHRPADAAPGAAGAAGAASPGVGQVQGASPWTMMDELAGSVEAPADWSDEHDHYLYGVPKRRPEA